MKKKMSEDTQTMIQHALDQDWNKANKIFGDMMSAKVQDVLDQEKIRLADQIYNGAEEELEDEVEEIDDEQLELELDDETDDQEGHEEQAPLEDADQGVQEPSDNVQVEVDDEDGERQDDPLPEES
jgi:hypothetical protein|tara:strand:+ start:159 stop:536 length:378 start_codon:yes stop_codon:yes gene_type:complete